MENETEKAEQEKVHEINQKNGINMRRMISFRVHAQLSYIRASKLAGVTAAEFKKWEYEKEPIPLDKYRFLMDEYTKEMKNQNCNNCYYGGNETDQADTICNYTTTFLPKDQHCMFWWRKPEGQKSIPRNQ